MEVDPASPLAVIVDDERNMSRVLRWVLEDLGYECLHFETAEDAVEGLHSLLPSVILVDVRLPGMEGTAFAEWVRAQPQFGSCPLVLMSAFREPADHRADGFISKPFDIEYLAATVRRLSGPPTPEAVLI